jgi:hypothetical protein
MSMRPEPAAMDAPDLGPLFAVRQDVGPFVVMGSQFRCNKARWVGKACVSPTAIYLLKKAKNTSSHGGGIAGVLLASALGKDDGLATCTAADLPQAVREQLDRKGKLGAKSVVIVPRTTVSYVKASGFNNVFKVTSGADQFQVSGSLFRRSSTRRKLAGWGGC